MKLSISQGFNIGPFKVTISKTGLSVSVGVPGARVGINSKGEGNVSVGVPGVKGLTFRRRKKLV